MEGMLSWWIDQPIFIHFAAVIALALLVKWCFATGSK